MKKRNIYLLIPVLLALTFSGQANEEFVEISPAQPTRSGEKIEVLEVFWYACSHCYNFEPYIKDWLASKAEDVQFRRMPGVLGKNWIPHARAYYTAEKLGVVDTIHGALFDAIHKKRKKIDDAAAIKRFFVDQGVDKREFKGAYESEAVEKEVKQAFIMGQRYKLTGVPVMIVNGKYRVSGNTAGSFENILKVVDSLVNKERTAATGE